MEADSSKKFSPSKLDTYKECPRRYQYRYVDKIKRDMVSVEAFVGQCVHKALEELYASLMRGKTLSRAEAVAVFEREWDKGWSENIIIRDKKYAKEDFKSIGVDCVSSYYQANAPFDRDKTVEVEKRIGFPLEADKQEYRIEGFIDRLALSPDGFFEIHDYKTSRTLPSQEDMDRDWQLPVYELAVRHAWPDAKGVRLIWHYLRFGRDIRSQRSPAQLENLKFEIAALIEKIKSDHEFSPKKSFLCDWCQYRDICPLWSHHEKVRAMAPERRSQEDGVKLVEQYGALELKKRDLREGLRRLEKEQEALEPRLVSFAQSRGLAVISGLEGEVALVEKEEYKFPTKTHSPEVLEALEGELKSTPLWREVSRLDGHLLMESYKSKAWEKPLMELVGTLISRYVKRSRETVLRFHRKADSEEG